MNNCFLYLFLGVSVCIIPTFLKPLKDINRHVMPELTQPKSSAVYGYDRSEDKKSFWVNKGVNILENKLKNAERKGIAKNAILFLGDGMSVATLTASRVFLGQQSKQPGEETELSFEKFPYTGLSKTYCVNKQVPDSACTATAYLNGVKGNYKTIGVSAAVKLRDCDGMNKEEYQTSSIATWAQNAGKATGLVTTARVTHASPAGMFAHTAHRDWESDADIAQDNFDPEKCMDIAKQLVTQSPGNKLKVILGGGRTMFMPSNERDPEYSEINGLRIDGKNLIEQWLKEKNALGVNTSYVWNRSDLMKLNNSEYVLGLFEDSHMQYHLESNPKTEPTLAEMTEVAIKTLSKENNGFFLFVEGARIDMAHHESHPKKSFDETVEFEKAVTKALEMTNIDDTLIVVTSDHAHTMTISGYPDRGSDILTTLLTSDIDKLPYSTISYANGPGYKTNSTSPDSRYDLSHDKSRLNDTNYEFPAMLPMEWETHGADDVAVFARGPWAHLFSGSYEQNYIPYVIGYATRIGPTGNFPITNNAAVARLSYLNLFINVLIIFYVLLFMTIC